MSSCSKIERASGRSNLLVVAAIQRPRPRPCHRAFLTFWPQEQFQFDIKPHNAERPSDRPTDRPIQAAARTGAQRPPARQLQSPTAASDEVASAPARRLPLSLLVLPVRHRVSQLHRCPKGQSCSFLFVVKRCLSNAPERARSSPLRRHLFLKGLFPQSFGPRMTASEEPLT